LFETTQNSFSAPGLLRGRTKSVRQGVFSSSHFAGKQSVSTRLVPNLMNFLKSFGGGRGHFLFKIVCTYTGYI